jgi:colanic acid/amylovoran biosynthesis glycosyltransferase
MNTVISQAMASGLPVVTTRHSGLPEQVIDGKNGAVVEEGDSDALAERLVYLIEHPEIWPAYGRFARERALENYDSKKLICRQIQHYSMLLRKKRRT